MPFIHSHALRTSLLALFVSAGVTPMAAADGDISFKKAAAIAKQYVRLSPTAQRTLKSRTQPNKTGAPYYLFNDAGNKGFVLVAGNEAMGTVLARSTTASLDTLHAPEGLQFLLEAYRERFQTVQKLSATDRKRYFAANTTTGIYTPVAPMVKSQWGQEYPFNNNLGGYRYAGCVATAMAQIMYFHRWPEQGVGSYSYINSYDGRRLEADFSASRYAWNLMFDSYKRRYLTDEQKNAVGRLLHDVGVAVNMGYTPYASSSTNEAAQNAFKNYFSYNVGFASKINEGARGFINMLHEELSNGYPVYIAGMTGGSKSGGHAMVADGINANGLIHLNFGWDGAADAYYNLQSLAVGQTGNEFNGKPLSFNRQLEAVLAHPKRDGEKNIPSTWAEGNARLSFTPEATLRLADKTQKVFSLTHGFDIEMSHFTNVSSLFRGDVGVAIVDRDSHQVALFKYSDFGSKKFLVGKNDSLVNGGTWTVPVTMHIAPQQLKPGTYWIVPMNASLQTNGQLGEWVKMSKAPRMEIVVEEGNVKVTEENHPQAGYRVMGEIEGREVPAGKATTLRIPLRSLNAASPYFRLKLEILDRYNTVLQTVESNQIDLDGFDEQSISLSLTTDDNIRTGKYKGRLTAVYLDEKLTPIPLRTHEGEEFFKINVTEPVAKPVLGLSMFGLYDGSGNPISTSNVKLKREETYSIGGRLFSTGNAFSGTIYFYWQDAQSGDLREARKPYFIQIEKGDSKEFNLGNMKAKDFNVVNGRTYQLVAAFTDAGRKILIPITDGSPNTYTFTGSTYGESEKDNTYQPQTGDFVRIRLKSGKYLTAPSATESADTRLYPTDGKIDGKTLASPETIFRLTGNGLLSLSGGRAVRHASSSPQLTEGLQVADNSAQPDALTIKGAKGKHVIQWRSGGSPTTSEEVVIEKVNELPVLIGQFGYSTFYTPVDAVLNGAKVYGGTPQNDHLQLHELPNDIPAGTAFIISGRPNSWVTLSLQEKRSFPAIAAEKNALFGFDTPHAVPTDETFAFSRSTGTFMRLSVWQRPFRAYLSNRDHLISASPDGLKMGLITTILQTKKSDATTLLFNMKGIRIEKPIPGQIYVRNGKKFIAR